MTRRVLTYTLGFTMKMTFYSSKGSQAVIKEIDIDYINQNNTVEQFQSVQYKVDPNTAVESDTQVTGTPGSGQYRIVTTTDFINYPETGTLILPSSISGTFNVGEIVTGGTSGTTFKIGTFTPIVESGSVVRHTIGFNSANGYLHPGETLTGGTSNATATLTSYV